MRGLFITGTDTGVGKSILSASLLASMRAAGEPVVPHKPAVTGVGEEAPGPWPADHELLALAAGVSPEAVSPLLYEPAVSPHLAARLAGAPLQPRQLIEDARSKAREGTLIVEGIGGVLVPLTDEFTIRDLASALGLPVVIAARPGLGTINHTLLTIEAARRAELDVAAVVLTPWPAEPQEMLLSNLASIERLGQVAVHTLPALDGPDPVQLRLAGDSLPWRDWLGDRDR